MYIRENEVLGLRNASTGPQNVNMVGVIFFGQQHGFAQQDKWLDFFWLP